MRGHLVPGSSVEREELARVLKDRLGASIEPPLRIENLSIIAPKILPLMDSKDGVHELGTLSGDVDRPIESLDNALALVLSQVVRDLAKGTDLNGC